MKPKYQFKGLFGPGPNPFGEPKQYGFRAVNLDITDPKKWIWISPDKFWNGGCNAFQE